MHFRSINVPINLVAGILFSHLWRITCMHLNLLLHPICYMYHRYLYLLGFTLLLLLFSNATVSAQRSVRISGTVLQSDKKTPIPGAGIIRYGTTKAVVSDAEGKFLIDVAQEDTLLIRAVGYKPLLYLPQRLPVSELRVTIVLQEDNVMLQEVEVTSRPSQEMIQRALRNMNRAEPNYVKRPGYIPVPELTPPPPPPPTVMSPISLLYDLFSREGKELRKLQELQFLQLLEQYKANQENYNRFFKDNTGYEEEKP